MEHIFKERFLQLDNPTGVSFEQYCEYLKNHCATVDLDGGFANYCKATKEVHIYTNSKTWNREKFREFLQSLPKPVYAPCSKAVARWAKQFGFKQLKNNYIILE